MICPDCGKENPNDRNFCIHCGAILDGMTRIPTKVEKISGPAPPQPDEKPAESDEIDHKLSDTDKTELMPVGDGKVAAESEPQGKKAGSKEEALLRELVSDSYVIEGKLGSGGMAAVYLAHEIALDRKVAIKVLPQAFLRDEDFVTRFKREAQVSANLEHPNIVRIYKISEEENLCYFVMSYIPGLTRMGGISL